MRTPSLTTRWRTSFLVSARTASLISLSRPSSSPLSCSRIAVVASTVAALRSALSVMAHAFPTVSVPTATTRSKTSWP